MHSKRARQFAIAALFIVTNPASSFGFELDIPEAEIDEMKGTIRAHDLAVKDSAYFHVSDFCRKNGKLFLPSNATPTSSENRSWSTIKVVVHPAKKFSAETFRSTDPLEHFSNADALNLVSYMQAPVDPFGDNRPYCYQLEEISLQRVEFYAITSIDGKTSLSSLLEDLRKRENLVDD